MLNYEFFLHKIQRQYIILSYFHLNLCMDLESSTLLCLHPLESYDLLFIIMHRCEYNIKECLAFKNHFIKCIALLNRLTHTQYIYIRSNTKRLGLHKCGTSFNVLPVT